jgi:hypothetical protein
VHGAEKSDVLVKLHYVNAGNRRQLLSRDVSGTIVDNHEAIGRLDRGHHERTEAKLRGSPIVVDRDEDNDFVGNGPVKAKNPVVVLYALNLSRVS